MEQISPESDAIGAWLSAALDDPKACAEFKRDIMAWFTAGSPPFIAGQVPGEIVVRSEYAAGYVHGFSDGRKCFEYVFTSPDEKGYTTLNDFKAQAYLPPETKLYKRANDG